MNIMIDLLYVVNNNNKWYKSFHNLLIF